jgi:hypothetical protein
MTDLYILKDISQADLVTAIVDIEIKKWQKAHAAELKANSKFTDGKPDEAQIRKKYEGLSAEQTLALAATDRANTPAQNEVLSGEQAKNVGALLLQLEKNNEKLHKLHPIIIANSVDVSGTLVQTPLEPKELSAWLQANDKAGKNIPTRQWVAENKVGLTGLPSSADNGAEQLIIETRDGERRVVGNGNLSEPIKGYYGGVVGSTVGDGDLLDIYITKDIFQGLKKDTAYDGPVFVMQQMDKGKPDELKVGYAKTVDEFKATMTSTWSKASDFEAMNEGRYAELSQDEYKQLKEAIKKKPDITLQEFMGDKFEQHERKPTQKIGFSDLKDLGIALAGTAEDFWAPTGLPKLAGNLARPQAKAQVG